MTVACPTTCSSALCSLNTILLCWLGVIGRAMVLFGESARPVWLTTYG